LKPTPRAPSAITTSAFVSAAAFRSALRSFLRQSEQIARRHGLTPQRHLLLLLIKGAPDGSEQATVGDLGERLQLAQSTVTELICRAEEAGLVERRQSSDDARATEVRLTDEGERRLAAVFTSHEEERRQLQRSLRALDV
jgi:DNA-binding MarR family transcriptional regulator